MEPTNEKQASGSWLWLCFLKCFSLLFVPPPSLFTFCPLLLLLLPGAIVWLRVCLSPASRLQVQLEGRSPDQAVLKWGWRKMGRWGKEEEEKPGGAQIQYLD
jgi:hypothetical protein